MAKFSPLRLTGFAKTSNLIMFILTVGSFAYFSAYQLTYLRVGDSELSGGLNGTLGGVKGGWGLGGEKKIRWASPKSAGEVYWFSKAGMLDIGMQVHLWSVVPAGILLPLQFLPIMRRKYMYAHKLAGRLLFILLMIGNVTALMIVKRSFGGTLDTHVFASVLAVANTFSMYKAWSSIRNLHIDQHRAWVLRTWAYACSILSLRIAMYPIVIAYRIFQSTGYKYVHSCAEIIYMYAYKQLPSSSISAMYERYPSCANLTTEVAKSTFVVVNAQMTQNPEERSGIINLVFGASGVVGFLVNAALVEWYLRSTREEEERLRKYSSMRRKAMGWEKEEVKKDA
ncbi:hypothetical protein B0J14DRAFT_598183 [Halenospora varia]|nr:hypothetical protein B0J14DRAFT_598183 [Halenospora varia]